MIMIAVKNGDLLKSDVDIICHQTNCIGVMGGGIALQIRNIYPNVYVHYKELCDASKPRKLLGEAQFVSVNSQVIANCFGQLDIRSEKDTDYEALKSSLIKVKYYAEQNNKKVVGIPYKMGCGIGGGDWSIVEAIINEVFESFTGDVEIYKLCA